MKSIYSLIVCPKCQKKLTTKRECLLYPGLGITNWDICEKKWLLSWAVAKVFLTDLLNKADGKALKYTFLVIASIFLSNTLEIPSPVNKLKTIQSNTFFSNPQICSGSFYFLEQFSSEQFKWLHQADILKTVGGREIPTAFCLSQNK